MDPQSYFSRLRHALPDKLPSGLGKVTSNNGVAALATLSLLIAFASEPAAAQAHCSTGLTAFVDASVGMVFGYARPIMYGAIILGVVFSLIRQIFPFQGIVGIALIALPIAALGLSMFSIELVDLGFQNMGAPEPCTEILGGGS